MVGGGEGRGPWFHEWLIIFLSSLFLKQNGSMKSGYILVS